MIQCVPQTLLPRLHQDAGLPFSFPAANLFPAPLFEGLFFARSSGDKHG